MNWTIQDDLAHAEGKLVEALRELEKRVRLRRCDQGTSDLVAHCQEMLVIMHELLDQADAGAETDEARSRAMLQARRLARLQHEYGRIRLQ